MKHLITWMLVIALALCGSFWFNPELSETLGEELGLIENDIDQVMRAWEARTSNHIVELEARVVLVLPTEEDVAGEYQKFRVELENGHPLLVSHNLDLAMAVPIDVGSEIRLRGEYDWNDRGGIIHWTHADPTGERDGGWIEHMGRVYR